MPKQRSAIVIGAGIVGLTTSYALARRGWKVQLVDKEPGPAMGASRANGAQLSYCYTDALASPAVLANVPSILFKDEGLGISVKFDPAFAKWLAAFLRNCTGARFRENTLAALALAQESKAAMAALLQQHDIRFGQRVAGKMHLYFSDAEFENAKRARELKVPFGCEQIDYTGDQATAFDPGLEHISGSLAGAIFTPSEEVGDSYRFSRGILAVLKQHYDFTAHFGAAVTSLEESGGSARVALQSGEQLEADVAVICAACASKKLLGSVGQSVPIQPMKGYSFEMPLAPGSPRVSITDTARRIVFTNLGDRMRVAGFADLGNADPKIDPRRSKALVSAARNALPQAGDYDLAEKHWAGLRPMTPNSQPIISRPSEAIAINSGHGMLGWTMAMGSGERLAKLVS